MSNILILGANSDIALELAKCFASDGHSLVLVSRNTARLKELWSTSDHMIIQADVNDERILDILHSSLLKQPDVVIYSAGLLPDNETSLHDPDISLETMKSNYVSAVLLLQHFAAHMKNERSGSILGISSVAGERGKRSSVIYSSAKAGFTSFLDGLRNYLYPYGVHVMTVKPGYVRTKMISHIPTPALLTLDTKSAARSIYSAWKKRKNTVYVGAMWWWVMCVIRLIPEFLFKRMKL